jgi:hypothetical protein
MKTIQKKYFFSLCVKSVTKSSDIPLVRILHNFLRFVPKPNVDVWIEVLVLIHFFVQLNLHEMLLNNLWL